MTDFDALREQMLSLPTLERREPRDADNAIELLRRALTGDTIAESRTIFNEFEWGARVSPLADGTFFLVFEYHDHVANEHEPLAAEGLARRIMSCIAYNRDLLRQRDDLGVSIEREGR